MTGKRALAAGAFLALSAASVAAAQVKTAPNAIPPASVAQESGPYTGAVLGILDRYRHIASSFTSDSKDVYRGRFTYSFRVDDLGNVTGTGTGDYLEATWRLDGVNEGRRFGCNVPMFTQPFRVRITGHAPGDQARIRFALEGSREWNNDHPCGANFTGFASDGTRLADSLELVQPTEGIPITLANPRIAPLRKLEQIGNDPDRRVNLHEWYFSIGAPGTTPPPPDPGGGGELPRLRLVGTVGPGATISLTLEGQRVSILLAGSYTILVRDRSRARNFHLTGPGFNRRTPVARTGTFTWNATLRSGTYRYVSDPQASRLRRSFLVR